MKTFKEPYYLVDFNSSICNYEILINGMPAFINDVGGSISSHYPINHFILKSGKQKISLKIFPLQSESVLRKDASLEIKVSFYDASSNNYNETIEVFSFKTPNLDEKEYPIIQSTFDFIAEIPYDLFGWKDSKIIVDDKNFKIDLITFYKIIHEKIMLNKIEEFYELIRKKIEETNTSMYIHDSNDLLNLIDLFESLKTENMVLEEFPFKW